VGVGLIVGVGETFGDTVGVGVGVGVGVTGSSIAGAYTVTSEIAADPPLLGVDLPEEPQPTTTTRTYLAFSP
jgi:hypothetical protein